MSAKAIREATGKDILNRLLDSSSGAAKCQFAVVNNETNWEHLRTSHPWLETTVRINTHSHKIHNYIQLHFTFAFAVAYLTYPNDYALFLLSIYFSLSWNNKVKPQQKCAILISDLVDSLSHTHTLSLVLSLTLYSIQYKIKMPRHSL